MARKVFAALLREIEHVERVAALNWELGYPVNSPAFTAALQAHEVNSCRPGTLATRG